jgi:hypothetical protein
MKIERILAGIKGEKAPKAATNVEEKTASEKPAVTAPREALVAALHAATEKTAAAVPTPGPVEDLQKIASDLAAADKDAAVKEAQVLGQAFADAAISRFADWQKTASDMLAAQPAMSAVATPGGVDANLLKQAAEIGYQTARAELEKLAEAEYDQGWNETVEAIYRTAGDEFINAANVAGDLIAAARA